MKFGRKTYAIFFLLMALLIPLFFSSGIFDVYEGAKSMMSGASGSVNGGVGMNAAIKKAGQQQQNLKGELIKKTKDELAKAEKELVELTKTDKALELDIKNIESKLNMKESFVESAKSGSRPADAAAAKLAAAKLAAKPAAAPVNIANKLTELKSKKSNISESIESTNQIINKNKTILKSIGA